MKTYHHGGRFGDLFYALWTMRELGGGKLIVSDFHAPNWSLEMARTLESFLLYQPFIEEVAFRSYKDYLQPLDRCDFIDYDLQKAEGDFNPEAFPENPEVGHHLWPGNINIAKRYAVHFGLTYRPGEKWLEAPTFEFDPPVAMHYPLRRSLRSGDDWSIIREGLYEAGVPSIRVFPEDNDPLTGIWLQTATMIQTAKVFLGVVSGPHALAEGLGKTRLVEQADGCFNISVLPPSQCINGKSNSEVIELVRSLL